MIGSVCPFACNPDDNGAKNDLKVQPIPKASVTDKQLPLTERNQLIRACYAAGEILEAITHDFGISHRCVHQIITEGPTHRTLFNFNYKGLGGVMNINSLSRISRSMITGTI